MSCTRDLFFSLPYARKNSNAGSCGLSAHRNAIWIAEQRQKDIEGQKNQKNYEHTQPLYLAVKAVKCPQMSEWAKNHHGTGWIRLSYSNTIYIYIYISIHFFIYVFVYLNAFCQSPGRIWINDDLFCNVGQILQGSPVRGGANVFQESLSMCPAKVFCAVSESSRDWLVTKVQK